MTIKSQSIIDKGYIKVRMNMEENLNKALNPLGIDDNKVAEHH